MTANTGRGPVGPRFEIGCDDDGFPEALLAIPEPPKRLFGIGNQEALREGLAVVGARNATPYGLGCAKRFSGLAAARGIVIISGGARGCDSAAHTAAIAAGGVTVAFCGGGCDHVYPASNFALFQKIIDSGGALVSEFPWDVHPEPFMFRLRNRLIAGLAKATLIVEAGMPSGTFSTADEALRAGKDVWAVPGSITSEKSLGANYLIGQGAVPIYDDDSFEHAMLTVFGTLRASGQTDLKSDELLATIPKPFVPILQAILAEPLSLQQMVELACAHAEPTEARNIVMTGLGEAEAAGLVCRYPNGKYGPRTDTCSVR